MLIQQDQLNEFIADSGLLSQSEFIKFTEEAKSKKKTLSEILVNSGKISEDDLRKMQAYVLGIPFVDLKGQKVDFSVLTLIPEPIARNHNIVAFKKQDDVLEVAMLDTDDLTAIEFIKKKVSLKILPRLTSSESIKYILLQYQKSLKAEFGDLIQKDAESIKNLQNSKDPNEKDLKKMAEDLPVIRIIDTLIKHAILQGASDIHIEPLEAELLVRYRIDGMLRDAMILPKYVEPSITARIKVLTNMKLDEKRLPQDGRFKVEMNNERVSFRVSVLPTCYGEKTVMRLLRENFSDFTLEKMGFHGDALERIYDATKLTKGMILATGPTGSGKSTTLYTILEILNTPDVNISTIEDPIEYQMPRVNQTQVKPEIGFTFASGLRTLVRQDPDIIMVGEIRDGETASLAVNAALTGHLVLSTLHTNSAAGAIPRLLDMKVESFLLASTLDTVIGQRLVRRLTDAKEKYMLTKAEIVALGKKIDLDRVLEIMKKEKIIGKSDNWETINFYKPKPNSISEDGYAGRVGIHEVLKMSSTIKDLIMKDATTDMIEAQAKKEGMVTMLEDGIMKCVMGFTTIEEVLRVASE